MFDIGNLIARAIDLVVLLIFIRCILSWVRVDPYNPLVKLLYQVTDPILKPLQAFTLRSGGVGLDLSPLIAIFILQALRNLLLRAF
jgi:YggT family protein